MRSAIEKHELLEVNMRKGANCFIVEVFSGESPPYDSVEYAFEITDSEQKAFQGAMEFLVEYFNVNNSKMRVCVETLDASGPAFEDEK